MGSDRELSAHQLFEKEWPKLQQEIGTMAGKLFLPGWTKEDFMQEFKAETYELARWYDPGRGATFRTAAWNYILRHRARLMEHSWAQKRAPDREDRFKSIDVVGGDEFDEGGNSTGSIIPVDDFLAGLQERVGNAGRFSLILNLKSVDRIGKAVMFLFVNGFGVNEIVERIQSDLDPGFDHNAHYRVIRSLKGNLEVRAMLA